MMNEVLAIDYTLVPGFPAGSVVANIVGTVTGSAAGNTTPVVQSGPPGSAALTFTNLQADTYTYSVEGQDASGNTFGSPVTGSFTVVATATVSLSLPSSVTATQT